MASSSVRAVASRDNSSPLGELHLSALDDGSIAAMGIDAVRRALERVAVAQRRLDSLRLRLDQRLHQLSVASPAIMPEQVIVAATSVSRPEAKRDMQRVRTLDVFPGLCEAVLTGDVPAQHVEIGRAHV